MPAVRPPSGPIQKWSVMPAPCNGAVSSRNSGLGRSSRDAEAVDAAELAIVGLDDFEAGGLQRTGEGFQAVQPHQSLPLAILEAKGEAVTSAIVTSIARGNPTIMHSIGHDAA